MATHLFARIASEALFKSFTLTMNGVMTRNEAVIELIGDDGQAHIAGAALATGCWQMQKKNYLLLIKSFFCWKKKLFSI